MAARRRRVLTRQRKRGLQWVETGSSGDSIVLGSATTSGTTNMISGATEMDHFDSDITLVRMRGQALFVRSSAVAANVVLKVCIGVRIRESSGSGAVNPAVFDDGNFVLYACCILDFNSTASDMISCRLELDSKAKRRIHQPELHDVMVDVGLLDIGTVAYVSGTHGSIVASWTLRALMMLP